MQISIDWKSWRAKLLWGFFLSLPLGVLGSIIAGTISGKTNYLIIHSKSSFKGGQTVIDLTIQNLGDYDLKGLNAHIEFEKSPSVSVSPEEYQKYVNIYKNDLDFNLPYDFELKKGQLIEFRFISRGSNRIINNTSLSKSISSKCIISEEVFASWRNHSWLGDFEVKDLVIVISIIIMAVVIVALVVLVFKIRKLAIAKIP